MTTSILETTNDRKCFANFIQMEVTDALESLKLMPLPLWYDHVAVRQTEDWLENLKYGTNLVHIFSSIFFYIHGMYILVLLYKIVYPI